MTVRESNSTHDTGDRTVPSSGPSSVDNYFYFCAVAASVESAVNAPLKDACVPPWRSSQPLRTAFVKVENCTVKGVS